MRYHRMVGTDGGALPADHPLQVGAIIRVRSTRSLLPGPVFNRETCEWVAPRWVECDDPRTATEAPR